MKVVRTTEELKQTVQQLNEAGKSQALVPTMGFLHEAHLSLVDLAKKSADICSVSIFVNPKQFNKADDLAQYPRDEKRDLAMLEARGVDLVFIPEVEALYPDRFQTSISLSKLTKHFEGAVRPGHFPGVCTVVTLLFNLTQADKAVFGEKDFQQLRVVEQLVSDMHMPIEIVRGPLVREEDGLAMSSRNVHLTEDARKEARRLSKALRLMQEAATNGEPSTENLLAIGTEQLSGLKLEYMSIVDERTLEETATIYKVPARALLAANIGGVHLLDNMPLGFQ